MFNLGMHHTNLREISEEMKIDFREFCLFSETRFIQYAHRTYDHFVLMYPVLITKVQRDIHNESTGTSLQQNREHCETLLAQVTFILNLLFMRETSHLLTIFSKDSQSFDVFPFNCMIQFDKIKLCLNAAKDRLKSGKFPEIETIKFHSTKKSYNLWEDFQSSVTKIQVSQTFHNFQLLLPVERGRVLRSVSVRREEFDGCSELVKSCLINLLYTSNIRYFIYTIDSSPGLSGWWHVIRVLTSSSNCLNKFVKLILKKQLHEELRIPL